MTSTHSLRVLLLDDHATTRTELRVLQKGIGHPELAGEVGSSDELVDICRQLWPGVVLMGMVMPGADSTGNNR